MVLRVLAHKLSKKATQKSFLLLIPLRKILLNVCLQFIAKRKKNMLCTKCAFSPQTFGHSYFTFQKKVLSSVCNFVLFFSYQYQISTCLNNSPSILTPPVFVYFSVLQRHLWCTDGLELKVVVNEKHSI